MSVDVRIPTQTADRPAWAGVVGVAAACLSVGVLLASLGVTAARTDDDRDPPSPSPDSQLAPSAHDEAEASADVETAAPDERAAPGEPGVPEDLLATDAALTDESPSEALATPGSETALDATPLPASPLAAAQSAPPEVPTAEPLPTLSAPPARMERGRVAYLRCSGVERRRDPFPCPRDEALEIRAWNALDALARCPALTDASGEADVVLDFREGAAPEVRSRDTFARDVRRLDPDLTLACVAPAMATIRHQTGAQRLVVSLRFALR